MKRNYQPLVQAMLVLVIVGAGTMYFTAKPQTPEIPDVDFLLDAEGDASKQEVPVREKSRWDNLGKKPVFQTIIPTTPPPPKTPPPPGKLPPINTVLADWDLTMIFNKSKAAFTDRRTKQYFEMNVGQSKEVVRGKYKLNVTLTKLSMMNVSATFKAPAIEGTTELVQEMALTMK